MGVIEGNWWVVITSEDDNYLETGVRSDANKIIHKFSRQSRYLDSFLDTNVNYTCMQLLISCFYSFLAIIAVKADMYGMPPNQSKHTLTDAKTVM